MSSKAEQDEEENDSIFQDYDAVVDSTGVTHWMARRWCRNCDD